MSGKAIDLPFAVRGRKVPAQVVFFLALSSLHTIFFNGERIIWWSEGDMVSALALGALQATMFLGLLMALSFWRGLLIVGTALAVLVSSSASYFISTFQLKAFGPNTMGLVAGTNLEEAAGFLSQELVLTTALAVLLSILATWASGKFFEGPSPRMRFGILAVIGAVSALVHATVKEKLPLGLPFDVLKNSLAYISERGRLQGFLMDRERMPAPTASFEGDEMIVVVIIGEAARADHFEINGYSRPTTPHLARDQVISFSDVTSCGTLTDISVPCMITAATGDDPRESFRKPSLMGIFKAAGFPTAWISNQRLLGTHDTGVSALAKEADFVRYNNPESHNIFSKLLDEDLLPFMDEFLLHNPKKAFLVLHSIGSHWRYDNHYPDQFRFFTPTCSRRSPKACTLEEVINSYDNSIAYTDYFIHQVIERLREKKAMVWYVSDHGESLGEGGRWGHGQREDVEEQRKVPMIVWASESFKQDLGEKWENLLSKKAQALSHDHLFHSVIHCAGIETREVAKEMSLCFSGSRREKVEDQW